MKNCYSTVAFFFIALFTMAQTETQPYDVIKTVGSLELRFYPPVMMAKVSGEESRNGGFRYLFNYISGANATNEKIAMTTPVHMENNTRNSSMAFVLPKKFTAANTPQPLDKGVNVYQSEAGHYAAISYSGYTNLRKETAAKEELTATLKTHEIKIIGPPVVLVYNSPYKFYNRRNEVLIPIAIE